MFSSHDKLIFKYAHPEDGVEIYADPMQIHRELQIACGGRLHETVEAYNYRGEDSAANVARLEAQGRLAQAAFAAFRLQPIDPVTGQGILEEDALRLLLDYATWAEQKKTNGAT